MPHAQRILPDGCFDLIWLADRELVIAGPDTGPRIVDLPALARSSGVRLRPGAAGAVLGLPAFELRDLQVVAAVVWGARGARLEEVVTGTAPARRLELLADTVARRRAEPDFVKFALDFLDAVPDDSRARAAIEDLRTRIGPGGSMSVSGGTENERLTALALSPWAGARSRALFTEDQISADLDRIEREQQSDGGWTFDWLAWSPGQCVEWRGNVSNGAGW